ncbi:MAG: aminotransferase class V-fold PLP-dependent enzyme [Chloroflexales bacterium]|nr:aminotransferase class V-fold PLP-dependent enzyme [Chloroflexales bacterium]
MRVQGYNRLDQLGLIYLDYAGGSLYAETQPQEHLALLNRNVFGNPHSTNPASLIMTQLVEQARAAVLEYLNASPDEYIVIFTPNASGALKLIGEAYPFRPGGQLLLSADNHNSVNGIREFARAKGARHRYTPLRPNDLRLDEERLDELLGWPHAEADRLFAYPAQSNFSGVQHSLEWIARAQAQGWDVLIDAAAFLPTNRLDLSRWQPDFVTLSFYKIIGYPTGIGALVARRSALKKLRRPWFAGGTITVASVLGDGHFLAPDEAGFEDGTVNYLSIPAVANGLQHLSSIGIDTIHTRVQCLTGWLLGALCTLRHGNGARLITVHGPTATQMRGGTLALTLRDAAGQAIDYQQVEQDANAAQIALRTGCFCNPGASEYAHGLTSAELTPCFGADTPLSREHVRQALGGTLPGAVRVSLGIASDFADVYAFVQFARSYLA